MSGASTTQKISEAMFQKSLQDLIKGIRSSRDSNSEYISKAIAECKVELKSTDPDLKAEAVRIPVFVYISLLHIMSVHLLSPKSCSSNQVYSLRFILPYCM